MLSPAHKEKAGRLLTAGELQLLVLAALTILAHCFLFRELPMRTVLLQAHRRTR
jgi:hypothetical protein